MFEVDRPATQLRKLERPARVGIPVPETLTFVPVDFEREAPADRLIEAGLDPTAPSFFFWLGVVYYLTEEAVVATLRYTGSLPAAEIVFDYVNPLPEDISPEMRAEAEAMRNRTPALGEPSRTFLDTDTLRADMKKSGLHVVEDLAPADTFNRFLGQMLPGVHSTPGWRFLRAETQPPA